MVKRRILAIAIAVSAIATAGYAWSGYGTPAPGEFPTETGKIEFVSEGRIEGKRTLVWKNYGEYAKEEAKRTHKAPDGRISYAENRISVYAAGIMYNVDLNASFGMKLNLKEAMKAAEKDVSAYPGPETASADVSPVPPPPRVLSGDVPPPPVLSGDVPPEPKKPVVEMFGVECEEETIGDVRRVSWKGLTLVTETRRVVETEEPDDKKPVKGGKTVMKKVAKTEIDSERAVSADFEYVPSDSEFLPPEGIRIEEDLSWKQKQ